jgi:adenosylcobyric acid synthase
MTARTLMFMGTGSDVGKSLVVAGLCRLFASRGIHVAPFKPQNMSNNAVAVAGGEIGRAQALQARAARVQPTTDMNPLLLKPESSTGAQIILQGRRVAAMSARAFMEQRQSYMPAILESFRALAASHELVLVEGAGSPAETNLRHGDLANFGFARRLGLPGLVIGDIHKGGVIAALAGTHQVLEEADRNLVKGFIINKMHGDPELFNEGRDRIAALTGWPCLGVIPHFPAAARLPAEDSLSLDSDPSSSGEPAGLHICVFRLPRIANFDDLDPLRLHPGIRLSVLREGEALPADCRLAILPGSKATISDLHYVRNMGWHIDLAAHVRRGGHVIGLCGGFQMLGRCIHDPGGLEGPAGSAEGLGLLDVETTLLSDKAVRETRATHRASGLPITGYEIHLGETTGADCARPFAMTERGPDGATNATGTVIGTYLHGCFRSDSFRRAFLASLGASSRGFAYEALVDGTLDALAAHLDDSLDVDRLLALAAPARPC